MRIIFVQSYPAYHDFGDVKEWLKLENRDKWMPGLCAEAGHHVELWAVGHEPAVYDHAWKEGVTFRIRIFPATHTLGKSKFHYSKILSRSARKTGGDLYVIKGVDGGVGNHLIRKALTPSRIRYAMIIGGEHYSPYLKKAALVFHETDRQADMLMEPGRKFWHRPVPPEKLFKLPKSVDTALFSPDTESEKPFDIISAGRLIPNYKNYDALFELSAHYKIGFIGGGPLLEKYRSRCPKITWFGHVPHREMPEYLNRGRLFFHSGKRDHFPRVIPEAAACGLPIVAFESAIDADVLPEEVGWRLKDGNLILQFREFFRFESTVMERGESARKYAETHWHRESCKDAVQRLTGLRK